MRNIYNYLYTTTIDRKNLGNNDYTTAIDITSDGGNATVQVSMSVPLPEVRFVSGPDAGQPALNDTAIWELVADRVFQSAEYSSRLNGGPWSAWSREPIVGYGGLEESSLFGRHRIEARVRTVAGESSP